ncbi:polyadenylate-binding protein 2-like [Rhynchophorus ferrugineus]|uniref:polyadenylate-binding protein 2-like n=1 Tax=Rhynchophorus ferrugineus TaxID=354439 RepID=UPI003FCD9EBB
MTGNQVTISAIPLLGGMTEDHLDTLEEGNALSKGTLLNDADEDGIGADDPDLDAIKARIKENGEETEKLRQLQREINKQMNMGCPIGLTRRLYMSLDEKMEVDNRSIYVGNVDYGATAAELEKHFYGCGSINRVAILYNKFDGHPKGFAYVEFADRDSAQTAMTMDGTLFRGRSIKVMAKRTNRPGISTTNRPPRGRCEFSFRGTSGNTRGAFYCGYKLTSHSRTYKRGHYTPY